MKKALCKQLHKRKKNHTSELESDGNSDDSLWSCVLDSTGELHACKKCKLNTVIDRYTKPGLSKAIHTKETKINKQNTSNVTRNRNFKKSCSEPAQSKWKIQDNSEATKSISQKKSYDNK